MPFSVSSAIGLAPLIRISTIAMRTTRWPFASTAGRFTLVLGYYRPSFAAIADRLFTLSDGKFCQLDQAKLPIKAPGKSAEAAA